ncbi:hypothetical protein [Serratia marcescens]|uniref:hypothetical protein n=1 Tax=Serratia marcescens TaxID=615 RepID=UPI0021BD6CAB|nr:hypothetical protein [Serratia marcescens]
MDVEMTGLKELLAQIQSVRKQIPFATVKALISVVRNIEAAEETVFKRHQDDAPHRLLLDVKPLAEIQLLRQRVISPLARRASPYYPGAGIRNNDDDIVPGCIMLYTRFGDEIRLNTDQAL